MFSSVPHWFSNDGVNMVETLELHVRDPKDLIQVSMEDSRVGGDQLRDHAGRSYSRPPHPVGAFWQVVGGIGTVAGERGRTASRSKWIPAKRRTNFRRFRGVKATVPEEPARVAGESEPRAPAGSKMIEPVEELK